MMYRQIDRLYLYFQFSHIYCTVTSSVTIYIFCFKSSLHPWLLFSPLQSPCPPTLPSCAPYPLCSTPCLSPVFSFLLSVHWQTLGDSTLLIIPTSTVHLAFGCKATTHMRKMKKTGQRMEDGKMALTCWYKRVWGLESLWITATTSW